MKKIFSILSSSHSTIIKHLFGFWIINFEKPNSNFFPSTSKKISHFFNKLEWILEKIFQVRVLMSWTRLKASLLSKHLLCLPRISDSLHHVSVTFQLSIEAREWKFINVMSKPVEQIHLTLDHGAWTPSVYTSRETMQDILQQNQW